jgi:hypothetical protein
VIDDVAGGDFKKEQSKLKYKKIKSATGNGSKKRQSSSAKHNNNNNNDEDGADNFDEDDYDDPIEDELNYTSPQSLSANNSFNESDEGDIETKSSSLLSSLSSHIQYNPPQGSTRTEPTSPMSVNALYNYSISAASTPPKPRVRKDFTSVSILNRKRKAFEDPTWVSPPSLSSFAPLLLLQPQLISY